MKVYIKRFLLWLISFTSSQTKLDIAYLLLKEIQESKQDTIPSKYAEKIITIIIKSKGNKITDFILKD